MLVWRVKERKYCGPFAILNLSENGTQVTLNVDRGQRSGVFSADCVRPAPEMADVFLARISSTLSSYSNRAPGIHRAAYTKDEADVPGYVTEAVENKDPRSNCSSRTIVLDIRPLTVGELAISTANCHSCGEQNCNNLRTKTLMSTDCR
jgi:hypothetical protein